MAEAASKNFQVSATGGAGSKGQPAQYMAGGAYGEGKENMDLQTSAKINKSGVTVPQGRSGVAPVMPSGNPIIPLDAKTQRLDEPVSNGAVGGKGAGPEALQSTMMLAAQNNEDIAKMAALLPMYKRIAESPQATNSTRNYVRWLESQVLTASVNQ
jgi:hypothetical protein